MTRPDREDVAHLIGGFNGGGYGSRRMLVAATDETLYGLDPESPGTRRELYATPSDISLPFVDVATGPDTVYAATPARIYDAVRDEEVCASDRFVDNPYIRISALAVQKGRPFVACSDDAVYRVSDGEELVARDTDIAGLVSYGGSLHEAHDENGNGVVRSIDEEALTIQAPGPIVALAPAGSTLYTVFDHDLFDHYQVNGERVARAEIADIAEVDDTLYDASRIDGTWGVHDTLADGGGKAVWTFGEPVNALDSIDSGLAELLRPPETGYEGPDTPHRGTLWREGAP